MKTIIQKGFSMYMWFKGHAIGSIACTGQDDIVVELEIFGTTIFVRYEVNNNLVQFVIDEYKITKIVGE